MHVGRVHCCQGKWAACNRDSVAGTKKLSTGLDAGCFMTVDRDRSRIGDEPTKSEGNPSRANSPESKVRRLELKSNVPVRNQLESPQGLHPR